MMPISAGTDIDLMEAAEVQLPAGLDESPSITKNANKGQCQLNRLPILEQQQITHNGYKCTIIY